MIDARCTIPRATVRDRLSSSSTTNCFSLNLTFAAVPGIGVSLPASSSRHGRNTQIPQFMKPRLRVVALGVLSCFDRVRFRGSLRLLCSVRGMASWLNGAGVLLKDFPAFAQKSTERLRQSGEGYAEAAGRPIRYLEGKVDKEDLVREIREEQPPKENGLIAVLSTLETCKSPKIGRNPEKHRLELRYQATKCLHYYFYFEDGRFGLTHVRLMTW